MMLRCLCILALVACGGRQAAPKQPEPAAIARQLHEDIVRLADIAKRRRGDCDAMVTELRPHVARMRAHAEDVKRTLADPVRGPELRRHVKTYDEQHRGMADAIAEDLAQTYLSCKQNAALIDLVDQLPEL